MRPATGVASLFDRQHGFARRDQLLAAGVSATMIKRRSAAAEAGLAEEIDSVEWHASPKRWQATMARHARMEAAGLHVVHAPPSRVSHDGPALLDVLERAYLAALRAGPPPGIRVVRKAP